MGAGRKASSYAGLLKPAAIKHRFGILTGTFLDHQFERSSPIEPLSDERLRSIQSHPVVVPPPALLGERGTQPIEGLLFLVSLAIELAAKQVFEIGTFTGLTTWTLARNLPGATIDTLDLKVDEDPSLTVEGTDLLNRLVSPEHIYERLPHEATIAQHWGDSATFDLSPWKNRCDLVYIDGAHSRPYVESDTRNALEMISSAGVIVWDDYWRQVKGVRSVLDKLDLPLRRVPNTRLVVYFAR